MAVINYKLETIKAFIEKVKADFKCSYPDIGQIYEKGVVAKAAKYKPIRVKGTTITDAQRKALNYGFAPIPYIDVTEVEQHHVWEYQRPRGKEYNEYFRREDVLKSDGTWGYDKNAASPIQFGNIDLWNDNGGCALYFNSTGVTGYNPDTCVTLQDCIGDYYATSRYPSVLISAGVSNVVLVSSGVNIKKVIEENQGVCTIEFSEDVLDLLQTVKFSGKELTFTACLSLLSSGNASENLSQYDARSLEFDYNTSIGHTKMKFKDSIQGLMGAVTSAMLTYIEDVPGLGSLGGTWRKYKLGDVSAKLITPSTWNRNYVELKVYYTVEQNAGFVNASASMPSSIIEFGGRMAISGQGTTQSGVILTADGQKDYYLFVPANVSLSNIPIEVHLYAYKAGEANVALGSKKITLNL